MLMLKRPRCARDAGFVLVSVLWILAILSVIALGFARRAMLERRMAWYALDHEQAQQMARAAAERGLFEMRNMLALQAFDQQRHYIGLDQRWAQDIDLFAEGYFTGIDPDEFADDVCRVQIVDADRRIPLNHAPKNVLAALKPLAASTIDKILDRRSSSTKGYQPALFYSVDELREIQRFSDDEWFGTRGEPGLKDILCVNGDGLQGQININTAPQAVLESLPEADPRVVEQIMNYRNGPDGEPYTADDRSFQQISEIGRITGISAEKIARITSYCKTTSRNFIITGHASRRRGKVNAYCSITISLAGAQPVVLAWKEGIDGS